MSDSKKFLKGVTSGYAYIIASMILALWMVPFVLKFLTKPEYAIFAIAGDFLGWLSISSLGITAAFNSKGAQLIGIDNREELNILTSTTFFAQLATSIFILLGGIVIALKPEIIFGSKVDSENLGIVLALLVSGFFIQYITQPLNSILIADKQIHIDNYLKFGLLIIQTSLTIILLLNGFKLLSLAISSFISNIIISLISWYRVRLSFPEMRISLLFWRTDRMLFLLKNGLWFTLGGIAGILIFRTDSYLIGKYISLTLVASFVVNNRLYQIAEKLHAQFFNIARPYFAQIYGKSDLPKLSKLYNVVYYSSFLTSFVIGVGTFLISKWFIGWWVGDDFYLGDTINLLLCINFITQAVVLPNRIILATSLYKIKLHNVTRIVEGLAKFLLSVFFINTYGLHGIIIISILAALIFSNISLNYLSAKLLGEKFIIKLLPIIPILLLSLLLLTHDKALMCIIVTIIILILIFIVYKPIMQQRVFLKELYSNFRSIF